MMRYFILLPIGLLACHEPEEGIDRTVLRGNAKIVPYATEEIDSEKVDNRSLDNAEELPNLTYRYMTVAGNFSKFAGSMASGDIDSYLINADGDGDLTVTLSFETVTGKLGSDGTTAYLYLFDLESGDEDCSCEEECVKDACDCVETCEPSVTSYGGGDGMGGVITVSIPVVAGGEYAIQVEAAESDEVDSLDYSLAIESLVPTDDDFMVGAFQNGDVTERGNPVAGGSVFDWQWDETELAWIGRYEMLYFRTVENEYDADGAETITTVEGVDQVYLLGGSFNNLNASIPSGALFSSEALQVDTKTDGYEETVIGDWGLDTAEGEEEETDDYYYYYDTGEPEPAEPIDIGPFVLVIDTLMPKVIGWEYTEEENNDVAVDGSTYNLVMDDIGNANVLPAPSGPGFVDVIYGTASIVSASADWNHDPDIFALEVEDELGAYMVLTWRPAPTTSTCTCTMSMASSGPCPGTTVPSTSTPASGR